MFNLFSNMSIDTYIIRFKNIIVFGLIFQHNYSIFKVFIITIIKTLNDEIFFFLNQYK